MTLHINRTNGRIRRASLLFSALSLLACGCEHPAGVDTTKHGDGDDTQQQNPVGGDGDDTLPGHDGGVKPPMNDGGTSAQTDAGNMASDAGHVHMPVDAHVPQHDSGPPKDPGYVRVEAESFLPGPDGYYDTTPENQGGYGNLNEGVDVGAGYDPEDPGSLVVGYTRPGEWLRYSLTLKESANYRLRARVAHPDGGGQLSIYVDDRMVMRFVVPKTGGWDSWQWVEHDIGMLELGTHAMKVTMDSAGLNGADVGNLNFFDFVPGAAGDGGVIPDAGNDAGVDASTPSSDIVRVETEAFLPGPDGYYDSTPENQGGFGNLSEGVDVGFAGDLETPGSLCIGYARPGEWLLYNLVLTRTADYTLRARVAHESGGGTFSLYVDGKVAGSFTVPSTGNWSTWVTVEQALGKLEAGTHLLKLTVDTEGLNGTDAGNVNYLEFVPGPAIVEDAGVAHDAGVVHDAGMTHDAGVATDAGAGMDSGAHEEDAGTPVVDSGAAKSDASTTP